MIGSESHDRVMTVLGPHGRSFKRIFEGAQKQLRQTFGMHMVELPVKDRAIMTTEQKRKGQRCDAPERSTRPITLQAA